MIESWKKDSKASSENFEHTTEPVRVKTEIPSKKDEMSPPMKLSGLQKQVLALYRGFLRAARSKGPEERCRIESVVSGEFHHNAKNVDRKNFIYIEYLLRRGKRQLDQLNSPGTVGLSTLKVTPSTARTAPSQADEPISSTSSAGCQ